MSESELPSAELDVMSCLWARGPLTAGEIREALQGRRPMAHASVCTLLRRLEDKGFVSREKSGVGKSFSYQAVLQPKRTARSLLNKIVDRVFGGSGVALVTSLLETHPITSQEIEDLQTLLTELKKRKSRKQKGNRP